MAVQVLFGGAVTPTSPIVPVPLTLTDVGEIEETVWANNTAAANACPTRHLRTHLAIVIVVEAYISRFQMGVHFAGGHTSTVIMNLTFAASLAGKVCATRGKSMCLY